MKGDSKERVESERDEKSRRNIHPLKCPIEALKAAQLRAEKHSFNLANPTDYLLFPVDAHCHALSLTFPI